jgi:hypothetical protein
MQKTIWSQAISKQIALQNKTANINVKKLILQQVVKMTKLSRITYQKQQKLLENLT